MTIPLDTRLWDHSRRIVWVGGTKAQLRNLADHVDARALVWYQRWVDKHG